MKSFSVLDANLEKLLRRAYVPTLPEPHFRERLRRTFLDEVARRDVTPRRPSRRLSPLGALAAAAAVLVALLAGSQILGRLGRGPADTAMRRQPKSKEHRLADRSQHSRADEESPHCPHGGVIRV